MQSSYQSHTESSNSCVPAHYQDDIMSLFDNQAFGSMRVVIRNGCPWFVAADVCAALDLGNVGQAVASLDDDEKASVNANIINNDVLGGRAPLIISEPGLYSLVLRSRKPEAKAFKRWITHEILPALRRSGFYDIPNFRDPIEAAEAWVVAEKARVVAEKHAQIEYERAEHYRATKAEIGSQREATAMATASAAVRKASALENRLGEGQLYKQVKAIPWLLTEFEESRAMYQQVGKRLKSMSDRMGYDTIKIPSPEFPEGIKAYHVDVIKAFEGALMADLNMLSKYRKR